MDTVVAPPVLVVGPATGHRDQPIHLPVAVVNAAPELAELGPIEVSGVPAAFSVRPARRLREHAPGHWSWEVSPADLSDLELVGSAGQTGVFSLGVVATATPVAAAGDTGTRAALQLLEVTVLPDTESLRVAITPTPASVTLSTPPGWSRVALRTSTGRFVSEPTRSQDHRLDVRRYYVTSTETFDWIVGREHAQARTLEGRPLALVDQRLVSVPVGTRVPTANQVRVSWLSDRTVCVHASDGRVLSTAGGRSGDLTLTSGVVGATETFEVVPLADLPFTRFEQRLGPQRAAVLEVRASGAAQIGLFGPPRPHEWTSESLGGVSGLSAIESNVAGQRWALDESGQLLRGRSWGWEEVVGQFTSIAVGDAGDLWGLAAGSGYLYGRAADAPEYPPGDETGLADWHRVQSPNLPAGITSVSAGGLQVWVTTAAGDVYAGSPSSSTAPPEDYHWVQVDGRLRSVHANGPWVWGVDDEDGIWFRAGMVERNAVDGPVISGGAGGDEWIRVEGRLRTLHVSLTGRVYGIDPDGRVWTRGGVDTFRPEGTQWLPVDGPTMSHVTSSTSGVWAVDTDNRLWSRPDADPGATACDLPRYEVALTDSTVALTGPGVVGATADVGLLDVVNATGRGWVPEPLGPGTSGVSAVESNLTGQRWALEESGQLLRSRPGGWEQVVGQFASVSVADDGAVWGLAAGSRYPYVRPANAPDYPSGDDTGVEDWRRVQGAATGLASISAGGRGQVWATGPAGEVLLRAGIAADRPEGVSWSTVDGALRSVHCAGPSVWGLDAEDGIWFRTGVTSASPAGDGWVPVDGRLRTLSATASGRVWGTAADGSVWARGGVDLDHPAGASWQPVPGPVMTTVACSATGVWAVDSEQRLWSRRGTDAVPVWVDAQDATVRVGRGVVVGEGVLVSWSDGTAVDVSHLGVRTQGGSSGYWRVSQPGYVPLGARVVDRTSAPPTGLVVRGTATDPPEAPGVVVDGSQVSAATGRGHTVVVLDRATLATRSEQTYDTFGVPTERDRMAADLDVLDDSSLVCVYSREAIGMSSALEAALKRCGAGPVCGQVTTDAWAYALTGVPGRGESTGLEAVHAPASGTVAGLDLQWQDGAVVRDEQRTWTSNAPALGSWRASHVLVSGLPAGVSLTHGQQVDVADDDTTVWAVPAADVEDLGISWSPTSATSAPGPDPSAVEPSGTRSSGTPTATDAGAPDLARVSLSTTASWVAERDFAVWGSASTETASGYLSDGMNLWVGADSTHTAEVTEGFHFPGGIGLTVDARAELRAGSTAEGGIGAQTTFPCPACDGSGQATGPGMVPTGCERCVGTGTLTAPGARLHVYSGAVIQASVSMSVGVQVAANVSASGDLVSTARAGVEVVGDGEVYAGSGRYGAKGGGSTFAGAGVEASTKGSAGVYGTSVTAGVGVSSPGSVGVGGGGTAVWDGSRLSIGVNGELGVALFGVDIALDLTIDTGPLQTLVLSAWDSYGAVATTLIVNGGADAIAWSEEAGLYVARGAGDAVAWAEGAGNVLGDVFTQDVASFFADDVGGAFVDVWDAVITDIAGAFASITAPVVQVFGTIADGLESAWETVTSPC